ncbi:MAG: DHHA1 domain-containing protein [Candidatus Aenigmarchaeota archaeon]|nr:DHHA1 domain-containing protein [Candidatus Aenigmarchaeota archaeon]
MNELLVRIEDIIKKVESTNKICLVHHDDCDGSTSAALFSILLHNLIGDYPILFPISGVEYVNRRLINSLKMMNPDFVFVFDLTVDPEDLNIFKGLILDHHIFMGIRQREEMPYLNPRSFEEKDEKVPPVSYMTYKILNNFFPQEKVAWIAAIGITEDHRVDLCKDVFEKVKEENPELLKIDTIDQESVEKSFYGEFWDMVRSGRMVRGTEGAKTAVFALIECKDRPDKFINGLTQHSSVLRKFYEKLTHETQNCLKNVEKRGLFLKRERVIIYEQGRVKMRGMTSFLADKIRQRYPSWIAYVINKEYGKRKSKISIRLEQKNRDENLVEIIEKIKEKIPTVKGGGHKSAVGVILDLEDVFEFEKEFLSLIRNKTSI